MRIVDNIYHASEGYYGIDLGYRPTAYTKVRVKGKPSVDGNLFVGTGPEGAPYGQWFRLFTYQSNQMTFDCPNDTYHRYHCYLNSAAADAIYEFGVEYDGGQPYLVIRNLSTGNEGGGSVSSYELGDLDGQNNSTLKIWGDGNYWSGENTMVYEIWIYESGMLTAHYLPAVDYDSNLGKNVAGMYDEISQVFWPQTPSSHDIQWDEVPLITYSGGTNIIFDASGGTFTGTMAVMSPLSAETYHWGIKRAVDYGFTSAFTINVNGQSGLTEASGKTDGTFSIDFNVAPWDGSDESGGTSTKRRRVAVWHISIYDDATGELIGYDDYAQRIAQNNPLASAQPIYIGQDEVNTIYIGEDEVQAIYIGEDLVFGG